MTDASRKGAEAGKTDSRRTLLEKLAIHVAYLIESIEKGRPLETEGIKKILKILGFFQSKSHQSLSHQDSCKPE